MGNPDSKSRPSVILIHGFGFHSFVWEPVAGRLASNYTVHRLTLAGYDGAPGPGNGRDSERLAEHEGAHWVGWSMGGLVALSALEDGLRPRSLTLVASQPCMVARDDWPHAIGTPAFQDFRRRIRLDRETAMQHFANLVAHGDSRAQQIRDQIQTASVPDRATLEQGLDLLEHADLRGIWARSPVAQQCILGEHDALVPADAARPLRALRPETRFDLVRRSGHAPLLSEPDQCAELMHTFWQSLE